MQACACNCVCVCMCVCVFVRVFTYAHMHIMCSYNQKPKTHIELKVRGTRPFSILPGIGIQVIQQAGKQGSKQNRYI